MNFVRSTMALALVAASGLAVAATEVVPVSYTFDQLTDVGDYNYSDSTGQELTDGTYGVAGWGVNLGNGPAAEWVGWYLDPTVNIDFDFGQVVNINEVRLGSTQDSLTDVVLPSFDVSYWSGSSWTGVATLDVPEDSANNRLYASDGGPHVSLDLGGLNITAQKIRVTARHTLDGPWTFIDEVDFYSSAAAVPEPSAYGLALAGLGVIGATALRKRRTRG